MTSTRRRKPRPDMIGESGFPAGAMRRATEVPTAAAWPIVRNGCATASSAAPARRPGFGRSPSRGRGDRGAPGPGVGSGPGRGDGLRRAVCGASKRPASTASPPTPSMSAWCTFITRAAPSPSTPSTRVASHSGNAASKPLVAIVWARSRTSRRLPLPGRRMRRRCVSSSKPSSGTNCGLPRPGARVTARARRRGTASVRPAMRSRTTPQSGVWSRTTTATMVGRITGSAPIVHSSASEPLMVSTFLVPVLGSAITRPFQRDSGISPAQGIEPEVPNRLSAGPDRRHPDRTKCLWTLQSPWRWT